MKDSNFDLIIHAPNRLQICALLSPLEKVEFRVIRDELLEGPRSRVQRSATELLLSHLPESVGVARTTTHERPGSAPRPGRRASPTRRRVRARLRRSSR